MTRAMDKEHILNEIKRTAEKNGGKSLGRDSFFRATGIKQHDWFGKSWNKWNCWGDAQKEAGYTPNQFKKAYERDFLVQSLIALIRTLGHFPVDAERRREESRNKNFPSHTVWTNRLGKKSQMIGKVVNFCNQTPDEYQDILDICEPLISSNSSDEDNLPDFKEQEYSGFVYLAKSGKRYKIGFTNNPDRRQCELDGQTSEETKFIHSICVCDPSGAESYWHKVFEKKRYYREWFTLTASDVSIFKKCKFM